MTRAFLLTLLLATPALAQDGVWTLRERVERSKLVVVANVTRIDDRFVEVTRERVTKAYRARLTIVRVLRGSAPAALTLRYQRTIGRATPFPEVTIRRNKRYVLFLVPAEAKGEFRLVSPYFGAERASDGLLRELQALGGAGSAAPPKTARPKRAPAAPTRAVGNLLALARVERTRVAAKRSKQLKLWLILRNVGKRPLAVCFAGIERYCRIEVVRAAPQPGPVPTAPAARPAPPRPSDCVTIAPGGYVYLALPLGKRCALVPGVYRVRVRLRQPAACAAVAPEGRGWSGAVDTAWIRFAVSAGEVAGKGSAPTADPVGARAAERARWRKTGDCDEVHLGALAPGSCKRCKERTDSRDQALCAFCADELGICRFCRRPPKK